MAIEDFAKYKIIKRLGKGGMGEVFLAEDKKLSRRIALKFLSAEALLSKEQIHRFEQEALAISSLNHPNILTIYEIGQSDGREYLATEFVDGKTLREFISQESPDLQKILDVAVQIGAALETAHEQGIIHRDIKPENIMVRRDGLVKVLDFGLAKLVQKVTESAVVAAVDAEAPTRANLSTAPGLIMGTSFYLSPEQARGKTVDARTDIWSLGVVLYEAITRHHPFRGETTSDVIASILKTEPPPLNSYIADIPDELQRIVKKTLRKDREDRYQSARELLVDLKNLNRELSYAKDSDASITPVTQPNEPHPQTDPQIEGVSTKPQNFDSSSAGKTNRVWAGLAAVMLLALIVFSGWYFWRRVPETAANSDASLAVTQLINWKNDLGEKIVNRARFSPDGKFIAFSSTKNGKSDIWLKQVGGGEAIQITKDAQTSLSPVWSADGGQIAFVSERSGQKGIWKMPALGGTMTLIKPLDSLNYKLVQWSKDGKTIYYNFRNNLYSLDTASQQAVPLTNFDEEAHTGDFRLSPDEESFSYINGSDEESEIWIMKKGGEPKRLTNDSTEDSNPVWIPDGDRIVYNLTRNNINQIGLAFTDGRAPVSLSVNNDGKVLDVSPDGSKILFISERNEADLWGVKLDTGKEFQLTSDLGLETWSDVSPDNNSIAFEKTNLPTSDDLRKSSIMKRAVKIDTQSVLLAENGFNAHWSPDGTQLAFLRQVNSEVINLWTVGSEGGNARQITNSNVTFGGNSVIVPYNLVETQDYQWSADSKSLIFCAVKDGIANVMQVNADGTNETMLSANSEPKLLFFSPMISPDGRRVAWLSLMPDKKMTRTVWISEAGKSRSVYQSDSLFHIIGWSSSGNELIIKSLENTVSEPQVTKDVELFSLALDGTKHSIAKLPQTHFTNIQISPDRKQIAFVSRPSDMSSLEIIPSTGGAPKTIITGNDARIYFSNLVWSPDAKTIYYGKQASWSILSMIENFK